MTHRSIAAACLGAIALAALAATPTNAAHLSKTRISAPRITPFAISNSKARVAALINADGSIAYSKNLKSVTNPAPGVYCVTLYPNTDATAVAPVMAFNFYSTDDFAVFVTYAPGSMDCTGNSVSVVTYTTDSGASVLTNEGFTFVVP